MSSGCLIMDKTHLLPQKQQLNPGWGYRHVTTLLLGLGTFCIYAMRVNISIAIVAMVNNTETENGTKGECVSTTNASDNQQSTSRQVGQHQWDSKTQGLILSAFFIGYMPMQIPGGRLADNFGTKIVFGIGILSTTVLTLVTPIVTKLGPIPVIVLRVFVGLSEGVTFPALYALLGKWAPSSEVTFLTTIALLGATIGNILTFPISGILCASDFLGGWPSVFYIFGGFGIIWVGLWFVFAYDTPALHPFISKEERHFIESSIGIRHKYPFPWRSALSSVQIWILCLTFFTIEWGYYTTLTVLPTYMSKVQKFDLQKATFLLSIPMLLQLGVSLLSSRLADFLRNRYLSTTTTRKLFVFLGMVASPVGLLFIKSAGCDHLLVLVLLYVNVTLLGNVNAGPSVNHLDIAHNFSGTLFSITNTFGTASGIIAPFLAGFITNGNETISQWQIVFCISAGLSFFGGCIYIKFGTWEEQSWNTIEIEVKPPTNLANEDLRNVQQISES